MVVQNSLVPKKKRNAVKEAVATGGKNGRVFRVKEPKVEVKPTAAKKAKKGSKLDPQKKMEGEFRKAARMGDLKKVKRLHKRGIDVDCRVTGSESTTALGQAATNGKTNVVEYLRKNGADVNIPQGIPRDAIIVRAVQRGHMDVVKLLIENGENLLHSTKYGYNLLYIAASKGRLDLVKYLVKVGMDVNAKSGNQGNGIKTPLIAACEHGHVEVVKYLLENSAEVNISTQTPGRIRNTLLSIAQREAKQPTLHHIYQPIVELLKKHGAR